MNKKKTIIIVAVAAAIAIAAILFAVFNKRNDGSTGLHVYVTDENGVIVTDENGVRQTEEWITEIIYATDENGETYTNANGEKVTVKQTRPAFYEVIESSAVKIDKDGKPVKDANGNYVYEVATKVVYKDVTDKAGNKVTQAVTDKNGNGVTEENGKVVTEVVTEKYTEKVTYLEQITVDGQVTIHNPDKNTKPPKTTSLYDNPAYQDKETASPKPSTSTPDKHVASNSWINAIDGSDNDKFVDVEKVNSSTYVVLGQTESTDGPFASFTQIGFYSFVAKYNTDGKRLWICPIGSSGHTKIHDIAVLKDGSTIAVGETTARNLGFTSDAANATTYEAIVAKISADGKVLWIKNYGGSKTDFFTCVTATPDGGFVAAGRFSSADGDFASLGLTKYTPVFVKCDSNGKIAWFNTFNGSGNDTVNSIASDANGNIYAACQVASSDLDGKGNHGSTDIGIVKFSSAGKKLWVKIVGGSKSDIATSIYAGSSGCIFAGSYTSANGDFTLNRGGKDAYIAFCDTEGNLKWIRTFGGINNETINDVVATQFGYAAVGATTSSNRDFASIGNKGKNDGFVMSVNFAGNIEHVKSFAGSADESANAICNLDNKTYIVAGETYSTDGDFKSLGIKKCGAVFGKYYIY